MSNHDKSSYSFSREEINDLLFTLIDVNDVQSLFGRLDKIASPFKIDEIIVTRDEDGALCVAVGVTSPE